MSSRKPHKQTAPAQTKRIPAVAADWGRQFLKHLELAYLDAASNLPTKPAWADFRKAMLIGFSETLRDSGAGPEELLQLMTTAIDRSSPLGTIEDWTNEKAARRSELIDQQIQQRLSYDEAIELARLTAVMRAHFEQEEFVPLEGARRLHRQLVRELPERPHD
jgi:hypothetical protein